jgi:hypothetical protein
LGEAAVMLSNNSNKIVLEHDGDDTRGVCDLHDEMIR